MNKIIVITGPTATGKTDLSVKLCQDIGGEVISADSVQIYKKLNIGSAKPSLDERQGIPHHLMDFLEPDEAFSVADYCTLAKKCADDILSRGKIPVIVGGTGLYISSLVDNISFQESTKNEKIRNKLLCELEELGKDGMHKRLSEIDPLAASQIHPNNTKRVLRALEVFYTTGKTKSEQNAVSKLNKSPYEFILCALNVERELLYERINKRVDIMINNGLIDEVKGLLDSGINPSCQSMQGIGYKEVVSYLNGKLNMDECIEKIKQGSRNYAKRQLTWFKRGDYKWFDALSPDLYDEFRAYIGEFGI
ncbi:MAG: tRNA (adenosine(37)-N6)-dimethylallyltransferase MiaA [Clostridia bacterium]|nr:tRNA (adenosine(37)-N6)-dimethylallyltransferase MiaA [Clostridia bacterium]